MLVEHTTHGMQVSLKPRGPGRFFAAGFLAFWLCGWAVGEVLVLTALVLLVVSWVTVGPVGPFEETPEPVPTLVGAGFMLVWLIGWTFGGIMAIRQLLSQVWAEDLITAASGGLIVERRRGPFRSKLEVSSHLLRRIHVLTGHGKLTAETDSGSVEISGLGTVDERKRAATTLGNYLGLDYEPEADESSADLPKGWKEVISPEGQVVLVEDPEQRRKLARILAGLTAAGLVGSSMLVYRTLENLNALPLAAMICAATLGLAAGTNWLFRGRMEWRVGSAGLTLHRRYGRRVREAFQARALELTVSSDSDNDRWYVLDALASETPGAMNAPESKKGRRRVYRAIHDPTEPRQLARWLSNRTGLPFTDRTTPEAREAHLAHLKEQLSEKGRLGQWAVRLIEYAEARRR
jgi:hypothetical protein